MFTLAVSHEFDAPAAALWELLADFGDIRRWWPRDGGVDIESVTLEGSGIGMVRHIRNVGMPTVVSERLDALDADTRTLRLSIVGERPAGLTSYQATGRIACLSGDRCRLDYRGEFATASGLPDEARGFLLQVYPLMFAGLEAALGRQQRGKIFNSK